MVSSPHREHPPKKGYDFDTVNKQTCQTYSFGKTSSCHLSIDASLTKLFECMTLAYRTPGMHAFRGDRGEDVCGRGPHRWGKRRRPALLRQLCSASSGFSLCIQALPLGSGAQVWDQRSGKLVSPKWKNFKGLKLQWRDKIRLNNAIWRAWYMQYLEKRQNPVCHFVTPLDGSVEVDEHRRPEAITTEGKYWKSRIEIVIREYHKWRTYFKKRLQQHKDEDLSSLAQDDDMLYWHKHGDGWKTPVPMEEDPLLDTDMLMSEFSDTLFSTLSSHQPVAWPNPREIAHLGNADMIQPGLIPLQPNLDFMDTFEPFQDLFSASRSIFGSMLPAPVSTPAPDPSSSPAQRFPGPSKPPPVITHAASPTLTRATTATTFSQSQGLALTAHPSTCALALSPVPQPPAVGPPQARLTFVHPKPVSSAGGRPKQPLKIVPAPKPEPMSLLLKSARLAPATFPGQPPAVIMTSSPLKREGMLASTVSQPGMVLAPAAIPRAPAVAEFHSGILVTDLSRSTSGQPAPVSRLFSPGTVQDSLVKVEQAPLRGGSPQVPAAGPSRDAPGSGQASPCGSEQSPSPQSPQNNCSGKSANPKSVAALKGQSGCICLASGWVVRREAQGPRPGLRLSDRSVPQQNQQLKHISAEQKRRFNIKMGFNTLNSLISNNSKPSSHAITLQKTVEYITKLQQERSQMQEEARRLREEIEELNATILVHPALCSLFLNSAPQFSIIIKPLFQSFKRMVSTSSLEELHRTALSWLDQHCSLPVLRPMVLSTLRQLSTTTSILTDPSQLPEQASEAVTRIGPRLGES
ncbi:MLX-interacting protein [Heterocephalus glaber]|uniref:MLX-interacting protein n=1 Tax=Heterocephalus glaber TaxID=10181 RepID=G5AWQ2_HETGA|nr:MLX-interacting protein [Heterocephalus glaber]